MAWCQVGDRDGAKAVADLVMFNTSLRVLDLRGNKFGNNGAALFRGSSMARLLLLSDGWSVVLRVWQRTLAVSGGRYEERLG